jgi:hypothetical protein
LKISQAAAFSVLAALGLCCLAIDDALAESESQLGTFTYGPLQMTPSFETGAAVYSLRNAMFGNGSTSRTNERRGGRTWYEGYVKPGLDLELGNLDTGDLYARLSAIAAATRGDGEAQANSTTSTQPEHFGLEEAYVGWRSQNAFEWPKDAVDVSAGNQGFVVGDGFLIAKGTLSGGERAAYVLGPRTVFERTAILRLNTEPVRADFFHLEGTVNQRLMFAGDNPDTKLYGANVEWFESASQDEGRTSYEARKWYVGGTALKVYDADRNFSFAGGQGGAGNAANRDGLEVLSLRFGGAFIPGLDDLALYGEAAREHNGNNANGGTVRANAWYLQPQYTFSTLPWSPVATARYAHFSGDPDTNDRTDRSWDPLFSDAGPRGGNTWTQGIIYSQYVGANTNLNATYVGLEANPLADELKVGLAYYNMDFDRRPAGTSSSHLMDELDLYASWSTPIAGLTVSPGIAAGWGGEGQIRSTNAPDRTIWLGQVVVQYKL